MSIWMQSTLELRAGGDQARFVETMKELVSIVEGEGWLLVTAFQQMTGRLHTAVDIWKLPDMEAFGRGLAALRGSTRFPEIAKVLADAIERETVVLGATAAWVPEGR